MGKKLARVVILVSLMTAMSTAMADIVQYTDEAGNMWYKYIKGWTNPDFVITDMSEKDFNAMQESIRAQKEKRAVENAIRNTMFETGLNRTQAIEYMLSPKK